MTTTCTGQAESATLAHARKLIAAGIRIIPLVPGTKTPETRDMHHHPLGPVVCYRDFHPEPERLRAWFADGKCGLAVLTGTDARLYALDFDVAAFLDKFKAALRGQAPGLYDLLKTGGCLINTPSGGFHLYFRCVEDPPGNMKLAHALFDLPDDADVQLQHGIAYFYPVGSNKGYRVSAGRYEKCAIETRGTGGYAKTYPSPGYKLIFGDMCRLAELTKEQIETLLAVARSVSEKDEIVRPARLPGEALDIDTTTPWGAYNAQADAQTVLDLLESDGWVFERARGDTTFVTRPGKKGGTSGTIREGVGDGGVTLFHNFSADAPPFDEQKSYAPHQVFALLQHGGDFAAAARALLAMGYGEEIRTVDIGYKFKIGNKK